MAYAIDPTGQARKARTLTATDPATGATVTRRTDRVYVAAVVFTSSSGKVTAVTWAGRPDLAEKALAKRGGAAHGYRLAPVTADPWATPEPAAAPAAPVAAAPEPQTAARVHFAQGVTPATVDGMAAHIRGLGRPAAAVAPAPEPATPDPLAAAAAELAAAVITPATPEALATPEAWAIARAQAQAARAATPEPRGPLLPGEPAATPLPPAPGGGVAAHRAAAAAGRPVSLAALSRAIGRDLALANGGRIPGPAAAPTGDPLEGLPGDPGTPAARARHAEQGRRAAILWPVAQAIRGAGHRLGPAWASDGPILNGELGPVAALAALPALYLESAAAALAALPPVTPAQAQALIYCKAVLRAAAT